MGNGSFDAAAYVAYTKTTAGKRTEQVFSQRQLHKDLDPRGVIRESAASADHPRPTPVIIDLDVTGSMGMIADHFAREGLGVLFNSIYNDKPIASPHICFTANGDVMCDKVPFQCSQFEADNRIVQQLTQIYLEGGGGGNASESYNLAWYFAARRTKLISQKQNRLGFLFTIGDECLPEDLTNEDVNNIFDGNDTEPVDNLSLLRQAQRKFHVFHIIIAQGNYASSNLHKVQASWRSLLGENAITLDDYKKLPMLVCSIMAHIAGHSTTASPFSRQLANIPRPRALLT